MYYQKVIKNYSFKIIYIEPALHTIKVCKGIEDAFSRFIDSSSHVLTHYDSEISIELFPINGTNEANLTIEKTRLESKFLFTVVKNCAHCLALEAEEK